MTDETKTCVHCLAEVTLAPYPNASWSDKPDQQAWSDGKRHPFYCPKAIDLTHHVLDEEA